MSAIQAAAVIVFLLLFIASSESSQSTSISGQYTDNPVLAAFGFTSADVPRIVYLVRSPFGLPNDAGIVVLAHRRGSYLVSGSREDIQRLSRMAYDVIEIDVSEEWHAIPNRTWSPVTEPDPGIEYLVSQVRWAGLRTKIQDLENFATRYAYTPQCNLAAQYLFEFFDNLGLAAELQEYDFGGTAGYNVIAVQTGALYPDSIVVIGGHYDSISDTDPANFAPGADDNASGVAVVMTAAEILSQYVFDYTIHYVCFGGEEVGVYGSSNYVSQFRFSDEIILGALVCDMLGYWTPGADFDLEVEANASSLWLGEAVVNAAALYTETPCDLHVTEVAFSDNYAFWQAGYAALNHESPWEWYAADFNPFFHSTDDRLEYVDPRFTVSATKVLVAALATLAQLQSPLSHVPTTVPIPALHQNYPNPFNPTTTIVFTLPERAFADVSVFNVEGRLVTTVLREIRDEGLNIVSWDGTDAVGNPAASGVYFCRLQMGEYEVTKKMVLLR